MAKCLSSFFAFYVEKSEKKQFFGVFGLFFCTFAQLLRIGVRAKQIMK